MARVRIYTTHTIQLDAEIFTTAIFLIILKIAFIVIIARMVATTLPASIAKAVATVALSATEASRSLKEYLNQIFFQNLESFQ